MRRPRGVSRGLAWIGGAGLAFGAFLASLLIPSPMPSSDAPATRDPLITAAAILFLLSGFGAVVSAPPSIVYISQTGDLPGVGGIRFYGGALFERLWGVEGVLISIVPFAVLGALEILAGAWLWRSLEIGGALGLWLTPIAVVFLIGYGAPFFFVVVPLRVILVLVAWSNLT